MTLPQNSDLFYLSGIDQANTVLVLYPDAPNPQHRELLFIKATSEHLKIWEGVTHDKVRERHMCRYFSQVLSIGGPLLQCA